MKKILILLIVFGFICFRSQTVTTLAGSTSAFANGPIATALFRGPNGIALDNTGNLLVTDWGSHTIRLIDLTNFSVSTFAGSTNGFVNGTAANAKFNEPTNACVDNLGNVIVADFQKNHVRKISAGTVSTFPSNYFFSPSGVAVNCNTNDLYLVAYNEHKIYKISPSGTITLLAGSGTAGFADGTGASAKFSLPYGICVDVSGNIIIADRMEP